MKYIVMLGDGMSDYPVPELGNKTPLEAAEKPVMDWLAQHGSVGLAKTIPDDMPPGSDTANLSVMGYDPKKYYSGRSPLEAASMGIELQNGDVTFRCNLVTLSEADDYASRLMLDHSAGEISTEDAKVLIDAIAAEISADDLQLFAGISYRHCLVMHNAEIGTELVPPHDLIDQQIGGHLPSGRYGERLLAIMEKSCQILSNHPINLQRLKDGLSPANSCWFWGEGVKPQLPAFKDLYGLKGGVVCAVDLLKGIGICADMAAPFVEGATGSTWTDFAAKGKAALALLQEGYDMVYIHVEAPDECGHHGDPQLKTKAIAAIDSDILKPLLDALREQGEDFSVLLAPDHPTPVSLRTHTHDPIPFVLYRSDRETMPHAERYTEACAKATGLYLERGPMMMEKLASGDF